MPQKPKRNVKQVFNTHRLETGEEAEEECVEYTMFHKAAKEREPYRVDLHINEVQTSTALQLRSSMKKPARESLLENLRRIDRSRWEPLKTNVWGYR